MKYKTVSQDISVKQVIERSIFIGTVRRVSSVAFAKEILGKIRETYRDATHNAYAYRVNPKSEESMFSDDGEPSKSAGLPIYNEIRRLDVFDVVVVVSRYFGGVKLGIPGLMEAYGSTAKTAIQSAGIVEVAIQKTFRIEFPYSETRLVQHYIEKFGVKVLDRAFASRVTYELSIEEDAYEEFLQSVKNKTSLVKFL